MPAVPRVTGERFDFLTRLAFALSVVLLVARGMTVVYLRDVVPALPLGPGEPAPARGAGAGTRVVLDALSLLPAMLVLLRWAVDPAYRLARAGSLAAVAALAAWALASTLWAGDAFAALVEGSTWAATAALGFALANSCRGWADVRACLALAAGLLATNVAAGVYYLAEEHPALVQNVRENEEAILRQQGREPGSVAAEQFLGRVERGEFGGFAASPNTYGGTLAALGVLAAGVGASSLVRQEAADPRLPPRLWGGDRVIYLMGVGAGVLLALVAARLPLGGMQWALVGAGTLAAVVAAGYVLSRDPSALAATAAVLLPPAAFLAARTQSRTALAAAVVAGVGLAVAWNVRGLLVRRRRAALALAAGVVLLGVVGVVGYGLLFDTLPHVSMRFRWYYWTGAAGVFAESPVAGVGFGSFGDAYLAHRRPAAAEEVADPHNLFVRFFSETGVVGGLLAIAFVVLLAIDLTRPTVAVPPRISSPKTVAGVAGLAVAAWAVHFLAGVDLAAQPDYVLLETMKRGLFALVLVGTVLLLVARGREETAADDAPLPLGLLAATAAAGAFLLHGQVDVVLFEPTVLAVVALLAGGVIGVRCPATVGGSRGVRSIGTGAFAVAALAFIAFVAVPVVRAESAAAAGDDLVRANRPAAAVPLYVGASGLTPASNAKYLEDASRAAAIAGDRDEAERLLRAARELRPRWLRMTVTLAAIARERGDLETAAAEYTRALELNPTEMPVRLAYAEVLEALGRDAEAAGQLAAVLRINDAMAADEIERLPDAQADALRARLAGMPR